MASDRAESALIRYISLTSQIRDLSSPQVSDIRGADEYRAFLLRNFKKIGTLAEENNAILEQYWFPLIESERPLTEEEVRTLLTFAQALLDAYRMENIDLPMRHRQTLRLIKDAEDKADVKAVVAALDAQIEIDFALMHMTQRYHKSSSVCYAYRDEGFTAAHRLLEYLVPERFKELPDEASKHIVLVNARYISALFDRSDDCSEDVNENDLQLMRRALSLCEDPFYREQAPTYNWRYHEFRTLQYITNFTEMNNVRRLNDGQLAEVYAATKRMYALWKSDPDYFARYCTREMMDQYLFRGAYLAGEIGEKLYKAHLGEQIRTGDAEHFTLHENITQLVSFAQYLLTVDKDHVSKEDAANIAHFYESVIRYLHRMPKKGSLSYTLTFLSNILSRFIPVEGGMDFQSFGLSLLAALHPPTYVHSLSVAAFARCLAKHLLQKDPARFIGCMGCFDVTEVEKNAEHILEFTSRAALMHDFGKLMVTEVILTYGRYLFDEEFELIKLHPAIGARMLLRQEETAPFANVALLHHLWYNEEGGYPDGAKKNHLPECMIIDIITCADCLDASTDAVGRSYKQGKSLQDFISELHEGSGTRYAPYVVSLFDDPAVQEELTQILTEGRDEHYRETYRILSSYH